MSIQARVEALDGALPAIVWRWDPETDILSGSFPANRQGAGLTGTVELTDDAGSVAVVEVSAGEICGLDMVVWPEVVTVRGLMVPSASTQGRVVVARRPSRPGIAAVEVDTTLSIRTDPSETVFHLRVGEERPVDLVRVANHLHVEVDADGFVAGFWLTGVPAFPDFDDS